MDVGHATTQLHVEEPQCIVWPKLGCQSSLRHTSVAWSHTATSGRLNQAGNRATKGVRQFGEHAERDRGYAASEWPRWSPSRPAVSRAPAPSPPFFALSVQ